MKRIISGILSAVMALGISSPFAYAKNTDFTVTDSTYVSTQGYATREQAIACFIQAIGIDKFDKNPAVLERFTDMSKVSFTYREAMSAAVYSGLISGYEDNTLRPQAPISRIEAIVILDRALSRTELTGWSSIQFSDTPEWAEEQVARLSSAGIVKGYGDGTLGANDYLTLEQVNTLCDRIVRFTGPVGDYYTYVNSNWLNASQVTPTAPITSDILRLTHMVNSNIADIIFSLYRRHYSEGESFDEKSIEKKIINIYTAAANQGYRDKIGLSPISAQLSAIDNVKNIPELTSVMAELESLGFPTLITFEADMNIYNTSMYLPSISYGYLGLETSRISDKTYVESYRKYIEKLFEISGEENPAQLSSQVTEICEELASVAASSDSGTIEKSVKVCDINELKGMFKNLDLQRYFNYLGFNTAKSGLVYDKLYARTVDSLLTSENLPALKAFLKAAVLDSSANYLTSEIFNAHQEFNNSANGTALNNIPSDYAVSITQELAGWELGSLYIDAYFPESIKASVVDMTQDIIDEYSRLLSRNTTMSAETQAKAIKKLKTMKINAAFPDDMKSYYNPDMIFRPIEKGGSLMEYKMQYHRDRSIHFSKLINSNDNIEKHRWQMLPQTVNAMYDPVSNSITIPAGILQDPFFSSSASFEKNLGSIGSIIAHEISHAFDFTGAQFDENGNLNGWWTAQDYAVFDALCNKLIDEYDNITINGGQVNGTLTMNENLADIAGMSCIISLAGSNNPNLNVLFSSYAEIWRTKVTDEYADTLLKIDVHSPAKIRVNRVLSNFDEFISLYGIIEGDGMYIPKANRIKIYN